MSLAPSATVLRATEPSSLQTTREAEGREKTPQAYLLASRADQAS